jgi:hypothetical protein
MHFANYIVLGLLIAFMLGALSFTKKAAPISSTDHGGGKRRGETGVTTPILGLAQGPAIDPVALRQHQIG